MGLKIGRFLIAARNKTVLTQETVATRAGTTRETVNRYENDEKEPSLEYFLRLCVGMGIKPSEFFESYESEILKDLRSEIDATKEREK